MTDVKALCSTKAKRESLAAQLSALAARHGATASTSEDGPRSLTWSAAIGPYRIIVWFNGAENIGAFLGHWHMSSDSPSVTYPSGFDRAIGGTVNPFHRRKATTCEDTWTGFLASLERGFAVLAKETAE